ncbi:general secretion pathway protein GspM [Ectothiorhodospira shaposhnikovii]|uniref:type II secretion system protein GspM n=1 Tax=Ectothiorhodospira shaposhnikovii TaxID=1054 RepID=UPI0019058AC9|nr:type II secretion system protein M [Ectothiorhodospira shaposhnikovii]MBK1672922.1 general secretion pathway protein GspM [Ectothiorhodospira shaposhnikovii]
MIPWWQALSSRDRRILILGGLFLALILPYGLIWLPLNDRVEATARTVERLQGDLGWMEAASAQVRAARGQSGPAPAAQGTQSLLGLVDATARQANLASSLRRVQPEGAGTVRVWMENVAFDDLLRWLDGLGQQYGIQVSGLVVDRQPAAGRVNARLVLEGQGA